MTKTFLLAVFFMISSSVCKAQEWMTSLDAAQRIALVQDKFIFMIWEEASLIPYPVIMNDDQGKIFVFEDFMENEAIGKMIWENFVPVKVSESEYNTLYMQAKKNENLNYLEQLGDDRIKIMDANLNIVNVSYSPPAYFNLTEFMGIYALDTSFLKAELTTYFNQKDYVSAWRLASKYFDFSVLVNQKARPDILRLAVKYLDEAEMLIVDVPAEDQKDYKEKTDLLRLSQFLINDQPRKVLRKLKKLEKGTINPNNAPMVAYLYYTSYALLKDPDNMKLWREKVNAANAKKANLIRIMNL